MRGWRRAATLAVAGAGVLALVLSGCTPQASADVDVPEQVQTSLPEETVAQLQDAVTSAMAVTGSTGAIVGVWAPWSGTWVTGLGTQGPGGAEVTADMGFRAADVTRAMTCDIVYELAEAGTFSLDDAVSTWVSGLPGFDDITLGQLCAGTSGLGSYQPILANQVLSNPGRGWNERELMAYGVASPRRNDPGAAFADSDTNYLLAGLAVERATGQELSTLIAERVAQPLGLDATSLPGPTAAAPSSNALNGYWSQPNADGAWNCSDPGNYTVSSASFGAGDSGAVTDITDLGRYAQALASGALLSEENDRFAAPLPVSADSPTWFTAAGGAYQAGSLIGQYGSAPGYIVGAFADPETGMSVAVVLNNSGANGIAGAWLAWELAAIASKAPAADGRSVPEAGLPWTAQQMRDNLGTIAICPPAQ
ncbi:beta-lactamase family protein [Microbacterium sp. ACRRU]|jgi:D-alanyl-D-alanine carboxypeptidase|uniref:serine hydrolase domain-containing protein n=1 Tax=Microbacterium sp. ACRRU TaxID=2918204 RepID=UPI001EF7314A|nr:serine hydrolase domain-containing protein [Microbacterium sp. ACRRU]MCG7416766.1 beta-lactamase family protein [Microbacterium sp. ACRRU]